MRLLESSQLSPVCAWNQQLCASRSLPCVTPRENWGRRIWPCFILLFSWLKHYQTSIIKQLLLSQQPPSFTPFPLLTEKRISMVINRPFPNELLLPLFHNESWCTTFYMEMSFSRAFIALQIKLISIWKAAPEGKSRSEMAYSLTTHIVLNFISYKLCLWLLTDYMY